MKTIKLNDEKAVQEAVSVLEAGGLVIYPTETAYGVGVDATNPKAVDKLIEYKKIPANKPTSVAVSSEEMAEGFVNLNQTAKNFYKNFLPGPYTIISQAKGATDPRLNSDRGSLGIRIPDHNFIIEVIKSLKKPVTATSANSHGKKTPYSVQDVLDTLSEKQSSMIDLIVDGGELPKRPASTVIDTTTEELVIHRGGILDPVAFELKKSFSSHSVDETIKLGEEIFEMARSFEANLILVDGDLGAGKTHFTKGVASALGIERIIKSPTYNYVNEYKISEESQGITKLFHYDAWRIQSAEDLDLLRIEDSISKNSFTVIEWPGVIKLLRPDFFEGMNYLYVDIKKSGEDDRELKVFGKR